MDELYEYLKEKLNEMYGGAGDGIVIDMKHAFRLYHTICYMMQIRGIIEFQDDMCDNGRKHADVV